jgi:CRP/FNR family cyclic AMP-dependent transcriptional regulator
MGGLTSEMLETLDRDAWFRGISRDLRDALLREGHVRAFKAGAMIYAAGDEPAGLYAILTGEVRLLYYSLEGKYAFYYVGLPSFWFGALSELDGLERFSDAVARSDTLAFHVGHGAVRRLLAAQPRFCWDFTQTICRDLRNTLRMLAESKAKPPRAKTAQVLATLALTRQTDADAPFPLTQEQLAAMADVTRQTMSKILEQFERRQLIKRHYGKITVLDANRLAEIAGHVTGDLTPH